MSFRIGAISPSTALRTEPPTASDVSTGLASRLGGRLLRRAGQLSRRGSTTGAAHPSDFCGRLKFGSGGAMDRAESSRARSNSDPIQLDPEFQNSRMPTSVLGNFSQTGWVRRKIQNSTWEQSLIPRRLFLTVAMLIFHPQRDSRRSPGVDAVTC